MFASAMKWATADEVGDSIISEVKAIVDTDHGEGLCPYMDMEDVVDQTVSYFSHAKDFNKELVKVRPKAFLPVESHFSLDPPAALQKFRMYNSLLFWLGVVEKVIEGLLSGMNPSHIVFVCILSYVLAYGLFWVMTASGALGNERQLKWMGYALSLIFFLLLFNVQQGWTTLNLLVLPAALDFGQAVCCVLMLISGFKHYRDIEGQVVESRSMV